MFKPRRFLAVLAVVLLLGWCGAAAVRAVNHAPATAPPPETVPNLRAKIESPDAEKVEGDVAFPAVKFQTAFGTLELRTERLKELTVDKVEGEKVRVGIQTDDGTRYQGELLTANLAVRVGDETRRLVPVEGMKLKFHKPGDFGLLAALVGLVTLAVMEIVLGIDNIIVLAIVSGKLPVEKQPRARRIGLAAALVSRIGLLFTLSWLLGLTKTLFTLPEMPLVHEPEARGISGRDLVLLLGGLFLIRKSTKELHESVTGHGGHGGPNAAPKKAPSFVSVIAQIAVIDIVFSLDSVITAVGMVDQLWVMVVAMLVAVGVMMAFAEPISRFIMKHPTVKVLALSFLILIGVLLVAEGFGQHIEKGYVYFAMAFSMGIELVNMRMRKAQGGEKELAKAAPHQV